MLSNLPEAKEPTPVDRPDDSLDRLARGMAKLCHGSIAVVCTPDSAVAMALRKQLLDFHLDDRALAGGGKNTALLSVGDDREDSKRIPERFDTIVISDLLEFADPERAADILSQTWGRLASDSRLVVCVPNEDCLPKPESTQTFTRETLIRAALSVALDVLEAKHKVKSNG